MPLLACAVHSFDVSVRGHPLLIVGLDPETRSHFAAHVYKGVTWGCPNVVSTVTPPSVGKVFLGPG